MRDAAAKPSVTFICEGLVTAVGGAERVLCDVASHLAEAGHDVEIVTHEKTAGVPFFPLSPKVRVVPLRPSPGAYGPLRRILVEPLRDVVRDIFHALRLHRVPGVARLAWLDRQGGFRRQLQAHLAQHPRDVAIAFMPRAITALGLARTPYRLARIASTHTPPTRDFDERSGDNTNVAHRKLIRQALGNCDRITVLLEEFRDWYPPDLRARVVVLPNAVAVATQKGARENLVLAVGRHLPVKGHDLLIDAWARIANDFPDWRVELYGKGPKEADLTARIDAPKIPRIRLMGITRDTCALYARSAVLAHPSRTEGFSLVVAEALAAGLPAIGFADCPGVNGLIRDGKNGVLIATSSDREGRVTALADALAGLMSDPETRARLGANGPASVAQFAPDQIMQRWEDLICDVAQETSDR